MCSAIGLETAEGFADMPTINRNNGISDPKNFTADDMFKLKYKGRRYSFGYPAAQVCLSKTTSDLLSPTKHIGVSLSDDYMMHPDGSVSSIIYTISSCYFRVLEDE